MNDPHDYQQTAAKALAKCAANDPWFPQPNRATVLAWAEQIAVYRLNESDVLAGVTIAYRDHGNDKIGERFRPLPRDIVQAAITIRRDRIDRETTAERQAREDRADARLEAGRPAAATAEADLAGAIPAPYRGAIDHPCPTCGAETGQPCVVEDDRRGRRRRRVPCVRRCPPSPPDFEHLAAPARPTRSFSEPVHQPDDTKD
ncbi:hypothetical protein ACTWP6_05610 [Mycobacterium sp. 4D054]|uniref:hypothetical protein n=1 Tax=Mycobacterium sp. 4D054 TaxID=3457440 RepID=UPI003FD53697